MRRPGERGSGRLRPLWGFGRTGWALLPVLLACVALAWLGGLGVRYQIMVWITDTFGIGATYGFVLWLIYMAIWVSMPTFSLLTWLAVLPAFHAAPRRFRWVSVGVMAAYAVGWPLSHAIGGPHIGSIVPASWAPVWLAPGGAAGDAQISMEVALIGAVGLAMLVAATRSWIVAVGCGGALLVATARVPLDGLWWWQPQPMLRFGVSFVAWHVLVVGSVWWWAVRARRAWPPEGVCAGCGYDLRGLGGERCPECGEPSGLVRAVMWLGDRLDDAMQRGTGFCVRPASVRRTAS